MTAVLNKPEQDLLAGWMEGRKSRSRATTGRRCSTPMGGLRFAFYGRVSTEDFQDRASSRTWQREAARELIVGHGAIVAEFFDVGTSRRRAWAERPQAAALLAAFADPDRGFDALVVGEYERAFYSDQLLHLLPQLEQHGVQVWLPETNGPVDHTSPTHQALIMLLGAQSKREVLRSRFRTTAAMQAQAREQGRYLGGRPPYGYRLADAGPHPNAAHARWGRRLQRLEPDPATAAHVTWMFAQRLAGRSVASIARALNEKAIPCPSSVDPDRNPHRTGEAWTLRTVAAILANPRYTGRQVWNRQRSDQDPAGGRLEIRQRHPAQDWVISEKVADTPLVSEKAFLATQAIRALRPTGEGSTRTYLLAGLLRCGLCHRRMDSHWVNDRPGYRCRHGHTSAKPPTTGQPRNLYLREDTLLTDLASKLSHITQEQDPHSLAEYLRVNEITIVCGYDRCSLSSENATTAR